MRWSRGAEMTPDQLSALYPEAFSEALNGIAFSMYRWNVTDDASVERWARAVGVPMPRLDYETRDVCIGDLRFCEAEIEELQRKHGTPEMYSVIIQWVFKNLHRWDGERFNGGRDD